MIEVFVAHNVREAQRIRQGLSHSGIHCRMIVDADDQDWTSESLKLVDITSFQSALAEKVLTPGCGPVALFGGEDKASSASQWLRQGAIEYFAHGEPLTSIQSRVEHLQNDLASNRNTPAAKPQAGFVGESPAMRELNDLITRVAATDISLLVSGPSGVGKEVVARQVHQRSNRSARPFVAINCAAIPEAMLEATLFGHTKGAYTGAVEARPGKFELANGGTLLLDEITEMPVGLQAKLLRVLQEQEVERVGSNQIIPVDVRVLATTNRDPLQAVEEQYLREDLYYRLSVFPVRVPSLHARLEDVVPLAQHFLEKFGGGDVCLTQAAQQKLKAHTWPGNVRELENVVQRALVLRNGPQIDVDTLLIESLPVNVPVNAPLASHVEQAEIDKLRSALAHGSGTRKEIAAQLGISERTLRHKLKQLRDRGISIN